MNNQHVQLDDLFKIIGEVYATTRLQQMEISRLQGELTKLQQQKGENAKKEPVKEEAQTSKPEIS